jgi:hypothetical protein
MRRYICMRMLGMLLMVSLLTHYPNAAVAEKQTFQNPEAKSIARICGARSTRSRREACIRDKTEKLNLIRADTRLIWESVFEDLDAEPLTIILDGLQPSPKNDGPPLIIDAVHDVRKFGDFVEEFLINKRPHIQSTDALQGSSSNDELIGWAPTTFPRMKAGVYEIRLGSGGVSDAIQNSATIGLRRSGYRVFASESELSGDVRRIEIDVLRFWMWSEKDTRDSFYCEIEVEIKGRDYPFRHGFTVKGSTMLRGSSPDLARSWVNTGNKCLESFVDDMEKAVRYARNIAVDTYLAPHSEINASELAELLRNEGIISQEQVDKLKKNDR